MTGITIYRKTRIACEYDTVAEWLDAMAFKAWTRIYKGGLELSKAATRQIISAYDRKKAAFSSGF